MPGNTNANDASQAKNQPAGGEAANLMTKGDAARIQAAQVSPL